MIIVGCDFHPPWQQVAIFDPATGEIAERKLINGNGEAEQFYRSLPIPFLGGCGELWEQSVVPGVDGAVGSRGMGGRCGADSGQLCAQAEDGSSRRGAPSEASAGRTFPAAVETGCRGARSPSVTDPSSSSGADSYAGEERVAAPGDESRAAEEEQAVERSRTGCFSALPLPGWARCRRQDLLALLRQLDEQISPLEAAVEKAAFAHQQARLLMTQPGVGAITALAFVVTIGEVARFGRGKQVASYLGLIPREHSSGGQQRLGAISKQGNSFMRMLLVEAAQTAVRLDEGLRKKYQHRCHSKAKGVAKVAAARKLAVRLYWMLRSNTAYPEIVHNESSSRCPMAGAS